MPEAAQFDVFLSHSSKDKDIVRELAVRLKRDDLRVWFDEWEIALGDPIFSKVEAGLINSRILILSMSGNAFGSDWTILESQTVRFRDPLNRERRFIPLLVADTQIPGTLVQFKYLDWRSPNDEGYLKLLAACGKNTPASVDLSANAHPQLEDSSITPNCQTLATMLADPLVWVALQTTKVIKNLETEVRDIRDDRTFTLPTANALYALCVKSDIDAQLLLWRMTAVVQPLEGGLTRQRMDNLARNAVIAICIVLAERIFQQRVLPVATAAPHEVTVPIQSEDVAVLIASLHIYNDTGVQLEIGLTLQDGAPKALGAFSMTNTPLEIGYSEADSPVALVQMRVAHELYGQAEVKPGTAWKTLPSKAFKETQLHALKRRNQQTLGADFACAVMLTLDANELKLNPAHLMAGSDARREIKEALDLYTVLYGAESTALAATAELAETIENALNSVFKLL